MSLFTIILQIILTIPLTILLSNFNKKEGRTFNQILIPTIYIIVIAALIPAVKENIFLIVIFEILMRNFYITKIEEQEFTITNTNFIIESIISIALSFFTYSYFISKVETVIPNPEDIKGFIWFLIIIYMLYLFNISTKNIKVKQTEKVKYYKKEQNILNYAKFKNMYSNTIKSKNNVIINLLYSIMIYNNYNVSKVKRHMNGLASSFTTAETNQGIMQVPSKVKLTDEESILLAVEKIERKVKEEKLTRLKPEMFLEDINPNTKDSILKIYEDITEFQKK